MTGLYLSRLTVLCTVHALCVATLVRAIVLQVFLVAQECGFRLPTDHPQFTFLVSGPTAYEVSFLSLLSQDHSGAASGIILFKVWQFVAFVDVVLVSSNWIYLELKKLTFRLLVFPRVQRTASIIQFASHALWAVRRTRVLALT